MMNRVLALLILLTFALTFIDYSHIQKAARGLNGPQAQQAEHHQTDAHLAEASQRQVDAAAADKDYKDLVSAAADGDVARVRSLLDKGVKINANNQSGSTA